MSVLVKGMSVPNNCVECRLSDKDFVGECPIYRIDKGDYWGGRFPKCPLVELTTPHGNLIDKDALEESMLQVIGEEAPYIAWALLDKVRTFPVIVHSEGDN